MEYLSQQELIYLALGARLLAARDREQLKQQDAGAIKAIFEKSAKTYDELAAKCEGMAARMA